MRHLKRHAADEPTPHQMHTAIVLAIVGLAVAFIYTIMSRGLSH